MTDQKERILGKTKSYEDEEMKREEFTIADKSSL
jgi:hypothetical protein